MVPPERLTPEVCTSFFLFEVAVVIARCVRFLEYVMTIQIYLLTRIQTYTYTDVQIHKYVVMQMSFVSVYTGTTRASAYVAAGSGNGCS